MPCQAVFTLLALSLVLAPATPPLHLALHTTRTSESDLQISGLIRDLPSGSSAYVRFEDLLALPQTSAVISDDPRYHARPLHVTGVSLEVLAQSLDARPESDLIDALCTDRYRSYFPREYTALHQPILVLRIEGQSLAAWARQSHQYDPSPYLVMYRTFVPAFKVLAHSDEAQLPDNVVRLNFGTQARTFDPLAPPAMLGDHSPERSGFTIAKQNCLRCHFMGSVGGTKSGRTWSALGNWAMDEPSFFQAYIHNPQKIEPRAHMEGSPQYDTATLQALTRYFRTFSDHASTGPAR